MSGNIIFAVEQAAVYRREPPIRDTHVVTREEKQRHVGVIDSYVLDPHRFSLNGRRAIDVFNNRGHVALPVEMYIGGEL